MANLPMYFPPAPFDLDDARMCAKLVDTAYDMYRQWVTQHKPDATSFKWQPKGPSLHYGKPIWGVSRVLVIFKEPEAFAFLGWSDDQTAYLVFRGTESAADWADDLDAEQRSYRLVPNFGLVHDGFLDIYESMSSAVIDALNALPPAKKLFITGHSLGSALSTLAVPDVIAHTSYQPDKLPLFHYNLASPRVGDAAFATAYLANGVATYRIVNTCDLVPEVPAAVLDDIVYEHVGIPVDFSAQYRSIGGNHSAKDSYLYALLHPDNPQGPIS